VLPCAEKSSMPMCAHTSSTSTYINHHLDVLGRPPQIPKKHSKKHQETQEHSNIPHRFANGGLPDYLMGRCQGIAGDIFLRSALRLQRPTEALGARPTCVPKLPPECEVEAQWRRGWLKAAYTGHPGFFIPKCQGFL
jgi:hypothetical protein